LKIKEALKINGVSRNEKEYILCKLLNKNKMFLHLNPDFEFDEKEYLKIINLRKKEYPLEYIFNEAYFYGEKFYIEEGILVPRDDTEPLIDVAIKELEYYVNLKKQINITEIGVGSGIISITLAKKFPQFKFIATDINPKAIKISKINAKIHNVNNIEFRLSNLLNKVDEKIDIIISNPPYVEEDWEFEALKYEPKEALFTSDNGTFLLKEIVKEGIKRKVKLVICEFGYNQKNLMIDFFESLNIKNYYFYKDLSGNTRGFVIKFGL
jgi:release factor glutamine methyltransferase